MKNKYSKSNRIVFIVMYAFLLLLLVYAIIFNPVYIKDSIFFAAVVTVILFIEKRAIIPSGVLILGLTAPFFQVIGLGLNLYSMTFFGIGYDKYMHFANALCGTVIVYYLIKARFKHKIFPILIAAMFVLGMASIVENWEFVGSKYMHFDGPTIFAQGDSLGHIYSDLQTFDTEWDMLFNTMGVAAGGIICWLAYKQKHFARSS